MLRMGFWLLSFDAVANMLTILCWRGNILLGKADGLGWGRFSVPIDKT